MRKILCIGLILTLFFGVTGCDFFEDKANIKSPEEARRDLENAQKETEKAEEELKNNVLNLIKATFEATETQIKLDELENNKKFTTKYSYENAYNDYSKKLNNCSSNSECIDILKEGLKKMAEFKYCSKGNNAKYETYEEWANKLGEIYIQKIS